MAEAKQQWKAFKAEYQQQAEAIQGVVPQALVKLEAAQKQAQLLQEALKRYQAKVVALVGMGSGDAQRLHIKTCR